MQMAEGKNGLTWLWLCSMKISHSGEYKVNPFDACVSMKARRIAKIESVTHWTRSHRTGTRGLPLLNLFGTNGVRCRHMNFLDCFAQFGLILCHFQYASTSFLHCLAFMCSFNECLKALRRLRLIAIVFLFLFAVQLLQSVDIAITFHVEIYCFCEPHGFYAWSSTNACTTHSYVLWCRLSVGTLTPPGIDRSYVRIFVFCFDFIHDGKITRLHNRAGINNKISHERIELDTFVMLMFNAIGRSEKWFSSNGDALHRTLHVAPLHRAALDNCFHSVLCLRRHNFILPTTRAEMRRHILLIRFMWIELAVRKMLVFDYRFSLQLPTSSSARKHPHNHTHSAKLLTSFPDKITWKEMWSGACVYCYHRCDTRTPAKDCSGMEYC